MEKVTQIVSIVIDQYYLLFRFNNTDEEQESILSADICGINFIPNKYYRITLFD